MDIKNTYPGESHDLSDHVDTVPPHEENSDVPASVSLAETSQYFVESIDQARQLADKLSVETSRRSRLALKELDELSNNSAHVTAFRASAEFRRLKERVCNAERNVVVERDRYARLLSRYSALSERQADDVKRIECLQKALTEYQEINEALARQLEQQGSTLERLVMSMRRARDELARNQEPEQVEYPDETTSQQSVAWSERQLEAAVEDASQTLESFEDIGCDSSELAQQTFPMGRRRDI
jgi:hypothetical protein